MKSRRWIAAAALAAAVVFLVMVTGEHGPEVPNAAPVSSSEAVLASDGGPPGDAAPPGDGGEGPDRAEVIDALQDLLDALEISADELGACAGNGNGAQSDSEDSGDDGSDCEQPSAGSAEPAGDATITITAFAFGQPLTVAPGATVEVVNTDAAPHNVTAADGSFETPDLNKDDTATFTAPTAPGSYEFSCTLHPEMTGTLVVEADASGNADDRTGDQGRTRSSDPSSDSQRSGGEHDDGRRQHQTTAPGQGTSGGSSDGY